MFRISKIALTIALAGISVNTSAFTTHPTTAFGIQGSSLKSPQPTLAHPIFVRSFSNGLCLSMAQEGSPSKLVRNPESNVEITITAPAAATKAAYDKACAEVSKTISIPGFRKGAKIPAAVIENAMASKGGKNTLRTQAIQSLLNQLLEPALKEEHNLEPIGQPSLVGSADALAETFIPGEPIEMVVSCDVWPDIKWKEVEGQEKPYVGLKGSYTRKPFDEARFNQAMKDLAERYAVNTPAPEGKELVMGDACVVDMKGFMAAEDGVSKAEPLPDAASGDDVEVILGTGRYMEGLVEGLIGAKVGETRTVYVSFPTGLRDKTLAGKKAVFDVTIKEASVRTVPDIDDELANKIRPGLDAEGIKQELRKAVDEQDAGEWTEARNTSLAKALAQVMDVDVPDTLVTNQAREKYAQMMAEFRTQGMDDEEIKKLITPENFQKYKEIQKPDIVDDFKTSMATDEIARIEGIEVPSYQIDEQLEAVKKEAAGEDIGDENMLRSKIESTIMRRMVFDFLADSADLDVNYSEDNFDEKMMEELAQETLAREEGAQGESTDEDTSTSNRVGEEENPANDVPEEELVAEAAAAEVAAFESEAATDEADPKTEIDTPVETQEEKDARYLAMDPEERAFNSLLESGLVSLTPDPESSDYDNSEDDELAAQNVIQ